MMITSSLRMMIFIISLFFLAASLVSAHSHHHDSFETFSSSSSSSSSSSTTATTSSGLIREIHPLQHFAIHHEELSSISINEIPTGHHHRLLNGHHQPYPEQLSFEIELFNQRLNYDLELQTSIIEPNLMSEVVYDDGRVEYERFSLTTYLAEHEHGYTVVTLRNDQTFLATIMHEGETYEVEPLSQHEKTLSSAHFQLLQANGRTGMVYFRQSDVVRTEKSHGCGTTYQHKIYPDGIDPTPDDDTDDFVAATLDEVVFDLRKDTQEATLADEQQQQTEQTTFNNNFHPTSIPTRKPSLLSNTGRRSVSNRSNSVFSNSTTIRRLMVNSNDVFSNTCFTDFSTTYKAMSIGFAVDFGFYSAAGQSVSNIQATIAQAIVTVNSVFYPQIHIMLRLTHNVIMATASQADGATWNLRSPISGRCTDVAITDQLPRFQNWRAVYKSRQASVWHLLTDCYPPPGTVGLAYVGQLCSNFGAGVSSLHSSFWITIAHEVGHNLGAAHTFSYTGIQQRDVGGIMDYCDGTMPCYSGNYAFDKRFSESTICTELRSVLPDVVTIQPYCFTPINQVVSCGNGIIEPGEECDDNSSCCVNCKLATGAQCSGGECCTSSCKFKYTTSQCNFFDGVYLGYCSAGTCQPSRCSKYANLANGCGMKLDNPCRELCKLNGQCTDSFSDKIFQNLLDGETCGFNSYCYNAACMTYNWVYDPLPTCSASCGQTKTVSRTFKCVASNNSVVANNWCGEHTQPITNSCNGTCSYAWSTAVPVGSCSVLCGGGTQSLSTYCYEAATPATAVSDSLCNANNKPATSRTCNTQTCPVQYATSEWSTCSVPCGGGSQTRTIQCQRNQTGTWSNVASSFCSGLTAPSTTQSCNSQACLTYDWLASAYGACTAPCGAGQMTRSVICRASDGTTAADSNCNPNTKPGSISTCNTEFCAWSYSPFPSCTASCGKEQTLTRNYQCAYPNNTIIDASRCGPHTEQITKICTGSCTYLWSDPVVSGVCSVLCGGGTQSLSTYCYEKETPATAVSDAFCNVNNKPATSQPCNNQVCPVQYATSVWSACSVPCGGGSQTRTIQCQRNQTGTWSNVASSFCSGLTAPSTTQSCNSQPCLAYNWHSSSFSECTAPCGTGQMTRTVLCKANDNTIVADSNCLASSKPSTVETCNTQLCPWTYDPFPACTAPCNQQQTLSRTYRCAYPNGTIIDVARCGSHNSPLIQNCTGACSYAWSNPVASGSCSVTCGGGTQSLSTYCYEAATPATAVSDFLCNPNTKPATTQSCNTQACPVQYATSEWSTCSVPCGGGSQTRTIQCQRQQNNVWSNVDLSFCSGLTAPATSQSCNTDICITYDWFAEPFSQCSQACDGGQKTRNVVCKSSINRIVDDSNCIASSKLSTIEVCNTQPCAYDWDVSEFNECSESCGSGIRTRQVICKNIYNQMIVQDHNCLNSKPTSSEACNQQLCPNYQWRTSSWSTCNLLNQNQNDCDGQQTRTVNCYDISNDCQSSSSCPVVADSYCLQLSSRPSTSQSCMVASCQRLTNNNVNMADSTVYWYTSSFNKCNVQCGTGSQSRQVECRFKLTNQLVADSQCHSFTLPKPSTSVLCNEHPCPSYRVSKWSACSAQCGTGQQYRNITCMNYYGQKVDDNECSTVKKPSISQVCQAQLPCPRWFPSEWSECSKSCGSGTQSRQLSCRMPLDTIFEGQLANDISLCPSSSNNIQDQQPGSNDVPATLRSCNNQVCNNYYWSITWSVCDQPCGHGRQQATSIVCLSSNNNEIVDDSSCLAISNRPSSTRSCIQRQCSSYRWMTASNWTDCNVVCGQGSQTRQILCVNDEPSILSSTSAAAANMEYEVVDNSYCQNLPKPSSSKSCNIDINICNGGSSYSTMNRPDPAVGRCLDGHCLCRTGYTGQYCSQQPYIRQVRTDAVNYQSLGGISMTDQLQISWESSSTIDYVSLILTHQSWDIPMYIVKNISNTGFYIWSLEDQLNDNVKSTISPASNYRIQVWYSSSIYDSSNDFTIVDNCMYINCGVYGSCSNGQCQCQTGWTGKNCEISTCSSSTCSGTCTIDGRCQCSNDFSGFNCNTPSNCKGKCLNDGDLPKLTTSLQCPTTDCQCKNYWTGSTCQRCRLSTICQNDGIPSADCSSCNCPNGYFGPTCSCIYYNVKMTLTFSKSISKILNDQDEIERLKDSLIADIIIALNTNEEYIKFQQLQQLDSSSIIVTLHLSGRCTDSLANPFVVHNKNDHMNLSSEEQVLSQLRSIKQLSYNNNNDKDNNAHIMNVNTILEDSIKAVEEIYSSFENIVTNTESAFYRGIITSSVNTKVAIVIESESGLSDVQPLKLICDPISGHCSSPSTSTDASSSPPSTSSSTSSSSSAAGAAIGATVAVIAVVSIVFFIIRRKKLNAQNNKQSKYSNKNNNNHKNKNKNNYLDDDVIQNRMVANPSFSIPYSNNNRILLVDNQSNDDDNQFNIHYNNRVSISDCNNDVNNVSASFRYSGSSSPLPASSASTSSFDGQNCSIQPESILTTMMSHSNNNMIIDSNNNNNQAVNVDQSVAVVRHRGNSGASLTN